MEELLRTNDPVYLSWVQHVLRDAGIEPIVMDQHAAAIEGSVNAIQRRIMVHKENLEVAQQIVEEAKSSLDREKKNT